MSDKNFFFSISLPNRVPLLLLVVTCSSGTSHAQSDNQGLHPFLGVSASYDSNVLGLSSPEAALTTTGTRSLSDASSTVFSGLEVQEIMGRQQLLANIMVSRTTFDRLSQLNNTSQNLSTNWIWTLGNNWNGEIGFTRVHSLAPYTDFHSLERNTSTIDRRFFSARWRVFSDWYVRSGLSRQNVNYDLRSQSQYNRNENQAEFGIDYMVQTGNVTGVQWRRADGMLPNQVLGQPKAYQQDYLEAKLNWVLTGKTTVNFLGGWVWRRDNEDPSRDFRGYNGRATTMFAVSDRTTITGVVWRETGIFDDLSTAYSVNRGASLSARWLTTEKLTVEALIRRERRDFARALRSTPLSGYRDTLRNKQVSVTYFPFRRISIQLAIYSSGKSTSNRLEEYTRYGTTLSTRYEL